MNVKSGGMLAELPRQTWWDKSLNIQSVVDRRGRDLQMAAGTNAADMNDFLDELDAKVTKRRPA